MILKLLALASQSPWFPAPTRMEIPWYTSFNVASSLFPKDDFRYMSPLQRLDPATTIRKLEKQFTFRIEHNPSVMLPTEAHLVIIHGKNEFYDDLWLRFEDDVTHFVSASRVGMYDGGVNRNRMTKIKEILH